MEWYIPGRQGIADKARGRAKGGRRAYLLFPTLTRITGLGSTDPFIVRNLGPGHGERLTEMVVVQEPTGKAEEEKENGQTRDIAATERSTCGKREEMSG